MSTKKPKPQRVALTTLGCKVNQYESASFISGFEERGAKQVPFSHPADIYIINTCAVTAKAGAQSRQMIRRALRTNPEARVVVTGCYAQVESQKILDLADRPICIVGNGNKDRLVDLALTDKSCDLEMYMGDISRKREICDLHVHRFPGRTRAFLKVQDGCDRFCSYCIVPYARGRSRSMPPSQILEQVDDFVRAGYREMVLTGIHVGTYGHDLDPKLQFIDLLSLLETHAKNVRFRISSLEQGEISPELLELLAASDIFLPHLHIPLQSGDNGILKKMNRRYTVEDFAGKVAECVRFFPEMAIGVDVMVGFPGEDDRAFRNTLELLEELPVAYLHVFPYSKRPGTVAAGMDNQVEKKVKEERVALLRELDHKKRTAFYGKNVGKVHRVLAEGCKNRFLMMKGFTDNYIPVYFQAPKSAVNQVLDIRIDRLIDKKVFGSLV